MSKVQLFSSQSQVLFKPPGADIGLAIHESEERALVLC